MNAFLGVDTSAYTTSVAVVGETGEVLADERILLKVGPGKRGLRQSEAHFEHTRNLPVLMENLVPVLKNTDCWPWEPARPRRLPDSYMPVFLAGLGLCRCPASVGNYPCICSAIRKDILRRLYITFPWTNRNSLRFISLGDLKSSWLSAIMVDTKLT